MSGSRVLILLSTLLAAVLLHPASSAGVAQECNALLAFKAGIKSDPQGLLSNWNTGTDCCTWFGTACDSNGHITQLVLSPDSAFDDDTYFLQGTISTSLAQLTHLQRLDFTSLKQLSGSLPAALGAVTTLQYLSFRRNLLTGAIPSSYGGLTSLTYVDLGENKLSGSIPSTLGNIGTQLQYIYLGNNQLSGAIPSSLYKLTGLQYFYLNSNTLSGTVSSLVGQLLNLLNLDFDTNQLNGALPAEIGTLPKLGFLDMSGNAFTGPIPTSFQNLKNLYHLTLDHNKLTGQIPSQMAANLKNLIDLDLSHNQLTGPIPQGAPFSTQFPHAFDNNAGLCGKPLAACSRRLLR